MSLDNAANSHRLNLQCEMPAALREDPTNPEITSCLTFLKVKINMFICTVCALYYVGVYVIIC